MKKCIHNVNVLFSYIRVFKKGHGKVCKNGHRWSKDKDGEIITLK